MAPSSLSKGSDWQMPFPEEHISSGNVTSEDEPSNVDPGPPGCASRESPAVDEAWL